MLARFRITSHPSCRERDPRLPDDDTLPKLRERAKLTQSGQLPADTYSVSFGHPLSALREVKEELLVGAVVDPLGTPALIASFDPSSLAFLAAEIAFT
jgi:hypothetical protein